MDLEHEVEVLLTDLHGSAPRDSLYRAKWRGAPIALSGEALVSMEKLVAYFKCERELLREIGYVPSPDVGGTDGPVGKPGRRRSTDDIADYVHARFPGMTYKEIYSEWKAEHPDDQRVRSPEMMRAAYRRKYRGKDRRRKREMSTG